MTRLPGNQSSDNNSIWWLETLKVIWKEKQRRREHRELPVRPTWPPLAHGEVRDTPPHCHTATLTTGELWPAHELKTFSLCVWSPRRSPSPSIAPVLFHKFLLRVKPTLPTMQLTVHLEVRSARSCLTPWWKTRVSSWHRRFKIRSDLFVLYKETWCSRIQQHVRLKKHGRRLCDVTNRFLKSHDEARWLRPSPALLHQTPG